MAIAARGCHPLLSAWAFKPSFRSAHAAFLRPRVPRNGFDLWRIWWLGSSGTTLKFWDGTEWRTVTHT